MSIDAAFVLTAVWLALMDGQLFLLRSGPLGRAALVLLWAGSMLWSIRRWNRQRAHLAESQESYAAVLRKDAMPWRSAA